MLPRVLPPATSLWLTKRWHGTPALAHIPAKTAAEAASEALLGCVELDDRSAAKHRMVGWVVLLWIVGMPCVSVVCRNHEGTLYGLIVGFLGATLCQGYATQHVRKEGTACSLLGLRTSLLVVEDAKHLCGVAVGSGKDGFESGKAH